MENDVIVYKVVPKEPSERFLGDGESLEARVFPSITALAPTKFPENNREHNGSLFLNNRLL